MSSLLVACAYLAMIFAPCAVAHWGDVLVLPAGFSRFRFNWFGRSARASRPLDALLVSVRAERELERYEDAFYPPAAMSGVRRAPATFAEAMMAASPERATALEVAAARVRARLVQMVEAHKLANAVVVAESAEEVIRNEMFGSSEAFATPSSAELEVMFASREAVEVGTEANTLHLLPDIVPRYVVMVEGDVDGVEEDFAAAETPPISIAA